MSESPEKYINLVTITGVQHELHFALSEEKYRRKHTKRRRGMLNGALIEASKPDETHYLDFLCDTSLIDINAENIKFIYL